MTTITFDTLKFVERLKAAGVPEEQAKAIMEAQKEALGEAAAITLATKPDIDRLERKLLEHDGEFKLLKWMLGLVLAAEVMPWLIKLFA
jgi:DNA-binding transcriptional MerR regulator